MITSSQKDISIREQCLIDKKETVQQSEVELIRAGHNDEETGTIPSQSTGPAKEIFWGQALSVAAMVGLCNFLSGYFENQDFTVSSMNFSGFLLIALLYRLYERLRGGARHPLYNFYNANTKKVNTSYILHTLIRSVNFLLVFWATVKSIQFANLAGLNFGIVSCCFYVSIVLNSTVGYFCFQEIITPKMMLGIAVTLAGIAWISLSKGQAAINTSISDEHGSDTTYYKVMSIMLAISVGCLNALQTLQTKFMVRAHHDYGISNIQADAGIVFGIWCGLLTLLNMIVGSESLTSRNFLIAFVQMSHYINYQLIVSTLMMIGNFIAQNCTVKGIAGPTIAIVYTHSLFCTFLQVLFLGLIPTLGQVLGAILALTGILLLILLK